VTGLRQTRTLAGHELRKRLRALIIWGVALGALGALYVALYPTMSAFIEEYVNQAPESMKGFFGELQGAMTVEQWLGMEFLNLLLPLVLPFMVMIMGARVIAGAEERKTLDLLLSNPLPRHQVVTGAALTMAASLAGVLAITWALTSVAVPIAGVDLSPARLAAALAALWPMCLLFGVFALLLSAFVRRSAFAITIPAVVLVAMYIIETLGRATKTMERFRPASFFYHLGSPVEGDFPWTAVLLMLAGIWVLVGAAAVVFARRDIYT